MEAERRLLKRRAEAEGPSAADYTGPDTRASLTMGVASLVVPLASHLLAQKVVPGKGRYGKALVGTALAAAATTTVADLVAGSERVSETEPRDGSRRWRRWADRVRRVTGPVAVGTGTLAVATWTSSRTNAWRMWEKGQRHDRGT